MGKRILFIAVVLSLVSTMAFAKVQGPGKPGSQGGSQSQGTYLNVTHGVVIAGNGSASFGGGGSTSANQFMGTKGGWASQSASSSVSGGGVLSRFCGFVSSFFSGTAITCQTQTLPGGDSHGGGPK